MIKAKVIVVGPVKSGKTVISNFLADSLEQDIHQEYSPTEAVRIFEFEVEEKRGKHNTGIEIELWDCSGSKKFQNCWSAMSINAVGAIIVYNPDNPTHNDELDMCYKHFLVKNKIKEEQCLLVAHDLAKNESSEAFTVASYAKQMNKVRIGPVEETDGPTGSDNFRAEFQKFALKLLQNLQDRRDAEEEKFMDM